MRILLGLVLGLGLLATTVGPMRAEEGKAGPPAPPTAKKATPADGHEIHVLAPHVVDGKMTEPFHHYCKVVAPDPMIECLLYETDAPNANLVAIEYIVAKTITRNAEVVPAKTLKRLWHDHAEEIATGRVQVLDLPPDKAKEVAETVAKTDGIVFVIWPHGAKLPTGKVSMAQSVAHVMHTSGRSKK